MSQFDRTRSSDWRTPTTRTETILDTNGKQVLQQSYQIGLEGEQKTIVDVTDSEYWWKRHHNMIVMNPVRITHTSRIVQPSGFTIAHPGWGTAIHSGDWTSIAESACGSPPPFSSYLIQNARDQALAKAYAKLNSGLLDGGELLGTCAVTAKMLRRPFGGAVDLLWKIAKRRRQLLRSAKTVYGMSRATANAWLEYRYGWTPLLLDAAAIIEDARTKTDIPVGSVERFVARGTADMEDIVESIHDTSSPHAAWAFGCKYTNERKLRAFAGVIAYVDRQKPFQDFVHKVGLSPRDWPQSAWELIPLSFVADWFVNVGDWLQASTPVPGIRPVSSWVTTRDMTTCTVSDVWGSLRINTSQASTNHRFDIGNGTYMAQELIRIASPQLTSTPVARPGMLSLLHTTDGLALSLGKIQNLLTVLRH